MADKIVQLVDEDNNNIYPISRGVAANSVDTAALKNNSVTEDKLTSDSKYVAGQSLSIVHGEKIPDAYQRVSYIQNTTNAYFELSGFSLTGADTITADIRVESSSTGWATIWCSRVDGTTDANVVFANTSDGSTIRTDYNTTQTTISWGFTGERHTFRLYQGNFSMDGWQQVTRSEATFTSPSYTTLMCSNLNGTTPYNHCYGRIYLFKVERGGETILNLVPCYRKSDSRVGLYDTISDTFYTYTGTGDYTIGAAIDSESNIIEVTQVGTSQVANGAITKNKIANDAFNPVVAKTSNFSMNLDKWFGTVTVMKAPKNPWVTIIVKATSAYVSAGGYFQVASGLPQHFTGNVDWNGYSSAKNSLGDSAHVSYDGKLFIGNDSAHSGSINSTMRITFLSDNALYNGV